MTKEKERPQTETGALPMDGVASPSVARPVRVRVAEDPRGTWALYRWELVQDDEHRTVDGARVVGDLTRPPYETFRSPSVEERADEQAQRDHPEPFAQLTAVADLGIRNGYSPTVDGAT